MFDANVRTAALVTKAPLARTFSALLYAASSNAGPRAATKFALSASSQLRSVVTKRSAVPLPVRASASTFGASAVSTPRTTSTLIFGYFSWNFAASSLS